MNPTSIQKRRDETASLWLRLWWAKKGGSSLRAGIAVMAIAAVVWLGYQFWRLLSGAAPIWPTSPPGAIDLQLLHRLVHHWFAGHQVYREFDSAVYPPATYVLLWPLLGWLDLAPARWLWGFTTVIALSVLIYFLVRESGADRPLEYAFVALIGCSIYATGAAIGNGQLIVHLLPVILATLFLLRRGPRGWREDLVAASLMIAAMAKPQIALPFLWLALFVTRSWRPVLLAGIGYGLVTLFALSFQDAATGELLHDWRLRLAAVTGGYGNVANLHVWLDNLGLEEWKFPASLLVWLALGFWVYRRRAIDLWILLGVTAYLTCFWTYHRWYDDVLLLLPMVALFRIIKREPSTGSRATAGVLLAAALLLTVAPGGLFLLPPPWSTAYVFAQTMVWVATLMFLLGRARTGAAERSMWTDAAPRGYR